MAQVTRLHDLVALGLRLYLMILTTSADKLAGHDLCPGRDYCDGSDLASQAITPLAVARFGSRLAVEGRQGLPSVPADYGHAPTVIDTCLFRSGTIGESRLRPQRTHSGWLSVVNRSLRKVAFNWEAFSMVGQPRFEFGAIDSE